MPNIEKLPPFFAHILDFQALARVLDGIDEEVFAALAAVAASFYIQTMDEPTTAEWEATLSITPSTGANLASRRAAVLTALSTVTPITQSYIEGVIQSSGLVTEPFALLQNTATFTLTVGIDASDESNSDAIAALIKPLIPAHIALSIVLALNANIEQNTYYGGFGNIVAKIGGANGV